MKKLLLSLLPLFIAYGCLGQVNEYVLQIGKQQTKLRYLSLSDRKILILESPWCYNSGLTRNDTTYFLKLDKEIVKYKIEELLEKYKKNCINSNFDIDSIISSHYLVAFSIFENFENKTDINLISSELAGNLIFYQKIPLQRKSSEFEKVHYLKNATDSLRMFLLRDRLKSSRWHFRSIFGCPNYDRPVSNSFLAKNEYIDTLLQISNSLDIIRLNNFNKKLRKAKKKIRKIQLQDSASLAFKYNSCLRKIKKAHRIVSVKLEYASAGFPIWNNVQSNFEEIARLTVLNSSAIDLLAESDDQLNSISNNIETTKSILNNINSKIEVITNDIDHVRDKLTESRILEIQYRIDTLVNTREAFQFSNKVDLNHKKIDDSINLALVSIRNTIGSIIKRKSGLTSNVVDSLNKVKLEILTLKNKFQVQKDESLIEQQSSPIIAGEFLLSRYVRNSFNDTLIKTEVEVIPSSVEVKFEGGTIDNVFVRLEERKTKRQFTFFNWNPIPFKTLYDNTSLSKVLLFNHSEPKFPFYIRLSDVIHFHNSSSVKSNDYSPKDITIINTERQFRDVYPLPKWRLNHYLTVKLFSDFAGFNDTNPNGLVQGEARFTTISNSRYLRYSRWVLFRDFHFDLNITKIENKLQAIPSERVGNDPTRGQDSSFINTFDFVRFSQLNSGFTINMIRFNSRKSNGVLLFNSIIGLYNTQVEPPINSGVGSNFSPIATVYGLETEYNFKSGSNVGVDISAKALWFRIYDRNIATSRDQNYSSYTPVNNRIFNLQRLILIPTITLYYNPIENVANRIFFRVRWFKDALSPANFFQAQLGYSVQLSKLFEKEQEKPKDVIRGYGIQ